MALQPDDSSNSGRRSQGVYWLAPAGAPGAGGGGEGRRRRTARERGREMRRSVAACRRVPRLRDLTLAPPRSLRFRARRRARCGGLRRPRRVPRAPYERVDAVPQPRRSRPSGAQGAGGCGRARFEPKRTDALPLARPRSPNLRKRLPSWSHCASSQVSGLSALWTRFSVTNCSCWQTP